MSRLNDNRRFALLSGMFQSQKKVLKNASLYSFVSPMGLCKVCNSWFSYHSYGKPLCIGGSCIFSI